MKDKETSLNVGDSFGLLPDCFWFSIHTSLDEQNGETSAVCEESAMTADKENEPEGNQVSMKRKLPASSPETSKKSRNDAECDGSEVDSSVQAPTIPSAEQTAEGPLLAQSEVDNAVQESAAPSAPKMAENLPPAQPKGESVPVKIKTEPLDGDANAAGPSTSAPVQLKTDIKTEIKKEKDESPKKEKPKEADQNRSQRECCPYGLRCFR